MLDGLRRRWWVPFVVTAVLAVTIFVLAPRYNDAQTAADPAAFVAAVADAGTGRTAAAAVVDLAFVVSYVTLAVALVRRHVATRVGAALVVAGGAADAVENTLVLLGIGRGDEISQGTVDAIRTFGTVKWAAIIVGVVVHLVGLVLGRRSATSG